ncbi:hypothetical protein QUW15_04820 [Desulfovibrio piger]|nr:hypothetical protein [Desulfovibrio piger]
MPTPIPPWTMGIFAVNSPNRSTGNDIIKTSVLSQAVKKSRLWVTAIVFVNDGTPFARLPQLRFLHLGNRRRLYMETHYAYNRRIEIRHCGVPVELTEVFSARGAF